MKKYDFEKYYRKKHPQKSFGLSDEERMVAETCLLYLWTLNPELDPNHFDSSRSMRELLRNDRERFELLFCNIVQQLELNDVLKEEEIPRNREFETFADFTDLVVFFMDKRSEKRH